MSWIKRPRDGAGDGFVTSIRGLFNTQRRKAKAFVLRTMRGEADNDFQGDWSESDAEFSPFARQLTITKAKRLIRRHTKKFRSRGQKGLLNSFSSILVIITLFFLFFLFFFLCWEGTLLPIVKTNASMEIISRDVENKTADSFTQSNQLQLSGI
jgi:hypothetical protein